MRTQVDLYGFGIMLWEMFTGKLPWSDKNYHQVLHGWLARSLSLPPIPSHMRPHQTCHRVLCRPWSPPAKPGREG